METKILVCLIILALLDMIIPIPFSAILLIYVVVVKPVWFRNLVAQVYGENGTE